jgi:hypothetical protein
MQLPGYPAKSMSSKVRGVLSDVDGIPEDGAEPTGRHGSGSSNSTLRLPTALLTVLRMQQMRQLACTGQGVKMAVNNRCQFHVVEVA